MAIGNETGETTAILGLNDQDRERVGILGGFRINKKYQQRGADKGETENEGEKV